MNRNGRAIIREMRRVERALGAGKRGFVRIIDGHVVARRDGEADVEITWTPPRSLDSESWVVEPDGSLLEWDGVAGHYTRCHRIGAELSAKLRALAEQAEGGMKQ